MTLRLPVAAAIAALGIAAPAADAAYTGAVDRQNGTASLTGTSSLTLSTANGLVHHGDIGSGFTSDTDFDSGMPGAQTVPDTGGWTIDATGKGRFKVQEGEPNGPISFANGHTFFPGGVPCIVRDPNDRHGATAFSLHPAQETRFCYRSGFDKATVRASGADTDFGVIDTERGVPVRMVGGAGDDELIEAASIPSGAGTPHNPVSAVTFSGGAGHDQLTLNDGPATAPATYKVGDGAIRKTGLPPLGFDTTVEFLTLYPQDGPSAITVGRTNGAPLALFGGWHHQHGPDDVDASRADGPLFATGSAGDDTIRGSVFPDYLDGGGGNDSIDSVDAAFDQAICHGGTGNVRVDAFDLPFECPGVLSEPAFVGFLHAAFKPKKVKRGSKVGLDVVSTAAGTVTVTFGGDVKKTVKVPLGPATPKVKLPRALRKGRYSVAAVLKDANGNRSEAVKLSLTVR